MKNFVAFLIGCLLSLFMLEFFFRFSPPFKLRVKGDKIVLPVNQSYILTNNNAKKLDKVIIRKINSLGFRGENLPKDYKNKLTIITVGGSTTECSSLSEENTWTYSLASRLKKNFKKIWVNNAGLDGNSTFGHIVLMQDYIVKLKPKFVLFLIGANDVGIWHDMEGDRIVTNKKYIYSLKSFFRVAADYSELAAFTLNFYRYIQAKLHGLDNNEIDLTAMETAEFSISLEKKVLRWQPLKVKRYRKRLEKLISISRENGITPVFITQPALYGDVIDDVTKVDLGKVKSGTLNGKIKWLMLERYNDVTRDVGIKKHVFVVDLAKEMPKSSRYYYDFLHYTNAGSRKVSGIIYKSLLPFLKKDEAQKALGGKPFLKKRLFPQTPFLKNFKFKLQPIPVV